MLERTENCVQFNNRNADPGIGDGDAQGDSIIRVLDLDGDDDLADVGLLMVYWTDPGDDAALLGVTPTTVAGFPSRAEMRDRYAATSGRDLDHLDFYVAFGYWKLACIIQGVYARYVGGGAAGDRSSVDDFGHSVVRLAEMAQSSLDAR